jgi:hypothetical protein
MNNQINDAPAFPGVPYVSQDGEKNPEGMTPRQYAAIKLLVPDSGLPWLDEMITKSNRQRFAAAALQGLLSSIEQNQLWSGEEVAVTCYRTADTMLKASEVKP